MFNGGVLRRSLHTDRLSKGSCRRLHFPSARSNKIPRLISMSQWPLATILGSASSTISLPGLPFESCHFLGLLADKDQSGVIVCKPQKAVETDFNNYVSEKPGIAGPRDPMTVACLSLHLLPGLSLLLASFRQTCPIGWQIGHQPRRLVPCA